MHAPGRVVTDPVVSQPSGIATIKNVSPKLIPDSKVRGAYVGPIWGRQDPGGPHVGPMNFAIWDPKL